MYFLDERAAPRRSTTTRRGWRTSSSTVAGEALAALAPARLQWGTGRATFAVNRRNNREEDVTQPPRGGRAQGAGRTTTCPCWRSAARSRRRLGSARGLLFGYACHATTLSGYQWSGDWPGFAQEELEKASPRRHGAVLRRLRRRPEPPPAAHGGTGEEYGRQAADGVKDASNGGLEAGRRAPAGRSTRRSTCRSPSVPTASSSRPTPSRRTSTSPAGPSTCWPQLDRDGKLPPTYPYPVQVWRLGDGPTLVLLGGEVVVDYSLRLKQELGRAAPGWPATRTT